MAITVSVPGYARFRVNGARGLVIEGCQAALNAILESETLYSYARRQPDARKFRGRATAYGISLGTGCGSVVVRHAMRGGLLARTGSDLFFPPTRGLRELVNSLRLKLSGVPTPEVVAIVSYPAGQILRRSDVATREIPESHDLSIVLREVESGDHRDSCLRATGKLLALLARSGAHHPDLNARNVLIAWDTDTGAHAYVLDVDRIRFHVPGDPMVANANITRLERSLVKLKETESLPVSQSDMDTMRSAAAEPVE
ncbi:MAG TPA: lipopolysaccharide kinase InaA family protein [Gemmatimonadaceae bacterium]